MMMRRSRRRADFAFSFGMVVVSEHPNNCSHFGATVAPDSNHAPPRSLAVGLVQPGRWPCGLVQPKWDPPYAVDVRNRLIGLITRTAQRNGCHRLRQHSVDYVHRQRP